MRGGSREGKLGFISEFQQDQSPPAVQDLIPLGWHDARLRGHVKQYEPPLRALQPCPGRYSGFLSVPCDPVCISTERGLFTRERHPPAALPALCSPGRCAPTPPARPPRMRLPKAAREPLRACAGARARAAACACAGGWAVERVGGGGCTVTGRAERRGGARFLRRVSAAGAAGAGLTGTAAGG